MSNISSSRNTFGLPHNPYGLVDKQKQSVGLSELDLKTATPQVTDRENLIMFDTRDCFGELSMREAQIAFAYDAATTGKIPPERFKEALNPDGIVVPQKLVDVVLKMQNDGLISGFPDRTSDEEPYVEGNTITFRFRKILKFVKSLEIINAIIPRDIVPVYVYFPGFINNSLPFTLPGTGVTYLNPNVTDPSSTWESPIPETIEDYFDKNVQGLSANKLGGVFQTPLRYWRAYTGPNCMSNPHTPPPYQLWNPPQDSLSDNPWPFQPKPVQGQRVPTYVAKNGVVFAGYGLYDLDDFPATQELQLADGTSVQIPLRKLILKLIVPEGQYINGVSARELIDISNVDDFNDAGIVENPLLETGYGDYQRFLPGPGLAMNYQPNQWRDGKSAPIDLSCSTYDPDTGYVGPMPVPFPNFRGNVWGPYGRPGDRFQNKSLQLTVDELYLNGDMRNIEGNSIIWPNYNPTQGPYTFELFITTLKRANNIVRFRTFETSSNPNIRNAMRIEYDGGFGAVFAYVGTNTTTRGGPGPIITGGLPNTQYDGSFHKFNPDIWVTPRTDVPGNWIQTLPGPQKPTITSDPSTGFLGWIYVWRNIFPWTGSIYVPVTAGGTGPMEYYDCDSTNPEWKKSVGSSQEMFLTYGSSQWSCSPVIGQSNFYCIPSSSPSTFEFVSNLPFGLALAADFAVGGTGYQDSMPGFPGVPPKYGSSRYVEGIQPQRYTLEVTSTDSRGTVLTFNVIQEIPGFDSPPLYFASTCVDLPTGPPNICDNPVPVTTDNNWVLREQGGTLVNYSGGTNYVVADNVITVTDSGAGSGLIINITSISNGILDGQINSFEIVEQGSGYVVGDVVRVLQEGSENNCILKITEVTSVPENLIPEYNIFHYTDPLAVGPARIGNSATVSSNYVNGVDTCTTDCPDNCTPPVGEYEFCVGNQISDASNACNDPRPTPDPPCMLKCDFVAQEGPQTEWDNDIDKNCRPLDNVRLKQTANYINRRVSYNDLGPNNGNLITSLINYRSFFVSSSTDTDLIIRIKQAERNIYTQSLNSTVDASNFYIPIRLNLGTTSGTIEYVEAVQGTLTSSNVYWKKDYYPPVAKMGELQMSLWTYDGTAIPIERSLGFIEQFSDQALLFSSSIASSFILHGSYSAFAPNLPPFSSTYTATPSSVIITGNNNSKTLSDPFNPKLERYTQRNLSLMFKVITYHPQNPGITEIIKKMPDNLIAQETETFEDQYGNKKKMIPLAGNIDQYGM